MRLITVNSLLEQRLAAWYIILSLAPRHFYIGAKVGKVQDKKEMIVPAHIILVNAGTYFLSLVQAVLSTHDFLCCCLGSRG
jgi:hypothetical protein